MFDIIQRIIDHNWISTNAGDQQYIYYICGALIIILTISLIDMLFRLFSHLWRS